MLAAALAYDFDSAAGVELLPPLHELALSSHARLSSLCAAEALPLAPCAFACADASEAIPRLVGRRPAVCFCYSTAWQSVGPMLTELSRSLARSLPVGSRVITVDKQLVSAGEPGGGAPPVDGRPGEPVFELVAALEGANYNTCSSTAYVYELVPPGAGADSSRSRARALR